MSKSKLFLRAKIALSAFLIISFLATPILNTVNADPPQAPKTNHLPQISVPAPGGVKVNTWNGNLFFPIQLLSIPGRGISIDLGLSYNSSWYQQKYSFGYGWQLSYNMFYELKGNGDIVMVWEDGRSQTFKNDNGNLITPADTYDTLTQYEGGKYRLTNKFGLKYFFDEPNHKKLTKIEEPNGNTLAFTYNTDKQLTKVTDSSNREVNLSYANARLASISDGNTTPSRTISFEYDTSENLTKITDPLNQSILMEYDSNHFITKIKDKNNNSAVIAYASGIVANVTHDSGTSMYFAYDKTNLITSVITSGENDKHALSRYIYDSQGRIQKFERVKDGMGNVIDQEFTWDSNNNLLTFKDENDHTTTYTYDTKGNILTITDALNHVTTYTYDSTFNKVASITDANNKATTYQYDTKGNLLKTIDPFNKETNFAYLPNGDLSTTTNAKSKVTSYTYNSFGYQTVTTDPLTHSVTASYDNAGRALSTTDANNNSITFEYDLNGNKTKATDALGHFETYAYDYNGNLVTKTDANGKITTYTYDKLGRLLTEKNPANEVTTYTYDKIGNLKIITDPKGGNTVYEYDYLQRLTKEIDPVGKTTTFEYDAAGNMVKKTDPNGNVINYTYDNANRLTLIDNPGSNDTSYVYDNVGNILTESNADATVTRTFDNLNRVLTLATTTNGFTKTVSYSYDDVGNRITMTDPDNGVTNYAYDDANRLTSITNPSSQITSYEYDNAGRLTRKTLGNGSYLAYQYDNANRVTNVDQKKSDNSVIGSFVYTYDNAGNKLTSTQDSNQTTYTYDNAYRLTSADYPGAAFENFTYDLAGNRLSLQNESGTVNSTYDASNKLLTKGSDTFTYDNNGNLATETQDEDASYEYNAANNLTKITFADTNTNEYKYYPDGRRLSTKDKAGNVTYFFYDGSNDLIETNNAGATQVRYTSNGIDEWLGMQKSGNSYYYQLDGQGSVSKILDDTQNTVRSYSYNAFGLASASGSVSNPFTYTGRRADSESNLYYYRARYYDAQNGRFTQKDPSGFVDGINLYYYTKNNPINFNDPTGKIAPLVGIALVGAAIGLGSAIVQDCIEDGQCFNTENMAGKYIGASVGGAVTSSLMALSVVTGPLALGAAMGASGVGNGVGNIVEQGFRNGGNIFKTDLHEVANQTAIGSVEGILGFGMGKVLGKTAAKGIIKTNDRVIKSISTRVLHQNVENLTWKSLSRFSSNGIAEAIPALSLRLWLTDVKEVNATQDIEQIVNDYNQQYGATSGIYAKLAVGPNGQQVVVLSFASDPNGAIPGGSSSNSNKWKATYFNDKNMNVYVGEGTIDTEFISKDYGTGGAPGTGSDNFSVRFEKTVYFDRSGDWRFKIKSDDGYRLYVDNEKISEEWWDASHDVGPTKNLSAGYHNVKLEYFEGGGNARVEMYIEKDYSADEGVWLCRITGNYQSHRDQCMLFRNDFRSLGDVGFGNDDAEAINIVGDWQAVLYRDDNFSGVTELFTGSDDDLNGNTIGTNQASSIRVKKNTPALFTLYDLGDFNGGQFTSNKTLQDLNPWNFNDTAESIRVASGYEAIVCSDSDFRGECGRTKTDKASIADLNPGLRTGNMQGTASSVKVCEGTCPPAPLAPTNVIPSNGTLYPTGSTVTMQWFGNGYDYDIELSGGNLSQPIRRGINTLTYWTKTDLTPSVNPYYWRVKSWNDFGEGSWSPTWSFRVQDITLTDVTITGAVSGTVETDYIFNAGFNPGNATVPINYNWIPTPQSGQGTATATYKFFDYGEKQISVTVSNASSTVSDTHLISIDCTAGAYETEYYFNNNLQGSPAFRECEQNVNHNWSLEGPTDLAQPDLTVTQNTTHVANYVKSKLTTTATGAQNIVSLVNTGGFAIDDEVLVIQMMGTNAGKYEYARIASLTATDLALTTNLTNTYTVGTNNKAQVIKVEKYDQVNVDGTLTVDAWNGDIGGILAIKANNVNVSSTGNIELSGKGFRGGKVYRNELGEDDSATGQSGESYTGSQIPWIHTWGGEGPSPSGALNGGAGSGGGGRRGPDTGGGGGGGSYGTAGTNGITSSGAAGGSAGTVHGNVLVDELYLGSGGGAGGRAKDPPHPIYCDGGVGGGVILIEAAETFTLDGAMNSNGIGGGSSHNNCGGGGGGAGGSVKLISKNFISNSTIYVNGGVGGTGNGGGNGGNGGAGRVMTYSCNELTGNITTTPNTQTSCAKDNFSARWSKTDSFVAGNYFISSQSDDGIRAWIDNNIVIDDWNSGVNENQVEVTLTEGLHNLKVEYFEATENANILFSVSPSTNEAPVVSDITDQLIGINDTFATFDLDTLVTDPNNDPVTWEITGNVNLIVSKDSENIVSIAKPQGWSGEETLTFKAVDIYNRFDTDTAIFKVTPCNLDQYKGEYFLNNNLQGEAEFSICEPSVTHDWGNEGPIDSSLPDLNVAANTTYTANTVESKITATANSGQSAITVSSTSGFAVNDEVLVIQMMGTNAGKYEYARIDSITSNSLTLRTNLTNTYTVGTNNKAQVIKIEKYGQITIQGTLTINAWNGDVGGILAIKANNANVSSTGTIELSGKGFRGGKPYRNEEGDDDAVTGQSGESYTGGQIPWIHTWGNEGPSPSGALNGGAGSGGGGRRGPDVGGGGGGGSYATVGANGVSVSGAAGGSAGATYGTALVDELYLGSGGGAGGRAKDPPNPGGCEGGAGGGALLMEITGNLTVDGTVNVNGIAGGNSSSNCGGGGGGSGGSIKLRAKNFTSNSVLHAGGAGGGAGANGAGNGGVGGSGRIMTYTCNSVTGSVTSNPNTITSCAKDNFSARWNKIQYFNAGSYAFTLQSDDGVRLWVDNNILIDSWIIGQTDTQAELTLTQGYHDIKVEYFDSTGAADIDLAIYPFTNNAPIVSGIQNQTIGQTTQFATFDLDTFGSDADNDPITWSYTGNSSLSVQKDQDNIVTITYPVGWFGVENITFEAEDSWGAKNSQTVRYEVLECNIGEFKTQYYNNTTLQGTPEVIGCESALTHNWGAGGPVSSDKFGNGQDGELIISTDTIDNPIDAQTSGLQGTTTLYSTNPNFATGQKILIHQTIGTNYGTYQINEIVAYSPGTITVKDPLNISYATDGAGNIAQVLVIKQYSNVTINNGATLSAKAWNGAVGGILYFYANGTITVNGTISAQGKGFRGGAQTNAPQGPHYGYAGEASMPLASARTNVATTNGGGGGREPDNNGGAGGGNGTAGLGGHSNSSQGGNAVGTADLSKLNFGGGGGAAASGGGGMENGQAGGNGGGIIGIAAKTLTVNGQITSRGNDGGIHATHFGGGAGAGGSIKLEVENANLGTNKVVALGGVGGGNRPGGAGGVGRIAIQYCNSTTGTTSPTLNQTQAACEIDTFSARWEKSQEFTTGTYQFNLNVDDGVRVWLDQNLIIDEWTNGAKTISEVSEILAGTHTLKVEYFENDLTAEIDMNIIEIENTPPTISDIPNQLVGVNNEFESFDLDNFGSDPNTYQQVSWSYTGNTELTVNIDAGNIVTITKPANWLGSENITFRITDEDNEFVEDTATFAGGLCNEGEYNAEFFNNTGLSGDPSFVNCVPGVNYDWGSGGPEGFPAMQRPGNGTDGDLTVASGVTSYTDDIRTSVTTTLNAGASQVSVSNSAGFAIGNEILIIQMQGSGTGTYEFGKITNIAGNTLTLESGIINSYTADTNNKVQLLKVNEYNNLTVNGTLTVHPWDGSTGGVMAFKVRDQILINGIVDVNGKGYRGGVSDLSSYGKTGESINGQIINQWYNNANGGGGGTNALEGGPGGAGGGNATAGANGANGGANPPGIAGSAVTNPDVNKALLGGAGGGGGRAYSNLGGTGGNGGGIIIIEAYKLNISSSGVVVAKGTDGGNGSYNNPPPENIYGRSGGGGAGAGGTVILKANIMDIGSNLVQANGGLGGSSGGSPAGAGGIGGNGYIKVLTCESLTGEVTLAQVVSTFSCPNPGVTNNFSVRFDGFVQISEAGTYIYNIDFDDGAKVWIDNTLILDEWYTGPSVINSFVSLTPGFHNIKVEYLELDGNAKILTNLAIATNEPPVIQGLQGQTISGSENFQLFDLDDYVTDINPNDTITWSYSGQSSLNVAMDSDKVVTITYPQNWLGAETITFIATDSTNLSTSKDVIFTVTQLNSAPVVSDILDQVIDAGSNFTTFDLDNYVMDPNDTVTWSNSGNTNLTVSINQENVATVTYPANWTGSETITFTATDSGNLSDSDSALFQVNNVNHAPVLQDIPDQSLLFSQYSKQVNLASYRSDPDVGDTSTWSVSGNTNIQVSFIGDTATISYPSSWYGVENLTFRVTDSGGLFAENQVAVRAGYCAENNFRGSYYYNTTLSANVIYTNCTGSINYDWGGGGPGNGISNDNFSVRWEGYYTLTAGAYTFRTLTDDGVRLWVNDTLIINNWTDHGSTYDYGYITLPAGSHKIRMEFYEKGGGAISKLVWRNNSTPVCNLPTGQFCAEYYNGTTTPWAQMLTYSTSINASSFHLDWGGGGPGNGVATDNFSAKWYGKFNFDAGTYRFHTYSDDGIRVYVDDVLVIDFWTDHGGTNYDVNRTMTAGEHTVRVEYYEAGGGAVASYSHTKL